MTVEVRDNSEQKDRRTSAKKEVDDKEHPKIHGGVEEGIGIETHLNGPMDYARKLKLRLRVGDPDLPGRKRDMPIVGEAQTS